MRKILIFFVALVLVACGGGGGGSSGESGTPPPVPVGLVSGVGFDSLVMNGVVKIYDYTTGTKGNVLASGLTDGNGAYSLEIQIESRPILIEVTGGYYNEEAGPGFQVKLNSSHSLSAVMNYVAGETVNFSTTTLTHIAAGLAQYQIDAGTDVAQAINDANSRVGAWFGIDLANTTPQQITDPQNASALLTEELRSGMVSGAISMWAYNHTPNGVIAQKIPYTSIDLVQLMYQDVSSDGKLDGFGKNAIGVTTQLQYGTNLLGPSVYRLGFGVAMLQMAAHQNNKTTLGADVVLPYVQAAISSTDTMFDNEAVVAIEAPVVSISGPTANAVLVGTMPVSGTVSTVSVLSSVELLVDNTLVATAVNLAASSFQLDTTAFIDGVHALKLRATDISGLSTTTTVSVLIANGLPTITSLTPSSGDVISGLTTISATTTTTVGLTSATLAVDGVVLANAANFAAPSFQLDTTAIADGAHTLLLSVLDTAGHSASVTIPIVIANVAPQIAFTSPAAGSYVAGNLTVSGVASSGAGLSSVELLVDGVSVNMAASLSSPSFTLDTTNHADGIHTLGLRATDVASRSSTASRSVNFNNIAPVVNITAPAASATVWGTITVSGTASAGVGLLKTELLVDSTLVATAVNPAAPSFQLNTSAFTDGWRSVKLRSTDNGGLVTTITVTALFDNNKPVVTITTPANNSWGRKIKTVTPTVTSGVGLSTVELLVGGVVVSTAANVLAPSFQLDTTAYADGAKSVAVKATDIGGRSTTTTITLKIDNTPPTASGTVTYHGAYAIPANTATGVVVDNYSGVVGQAVLLKNSFGGSTSVGTVASGGAWTNAVSGIGSMWLRFSDAAGNCSDYNITFSSVYSSPTTTWTLKQLGSCL